MHVPVVKLAMVAMIAMENVVRDALASILCQRQILVTAVQTVDQIVMEIAAMIVA